MQGSRADHRRNGGKNPDAVAAETATRGASSIPRWYLIYFVLAAFDILTLSGSLLFHHRLIGIHRDAMEYDQEWSAEFQRHIELATIIAEANAPGNDVFQSLDPESELLRMNSILPFLMDKIEETKLSLQKGLSGDSAAPLLVHLINIETAVDKMANDAERLFAHVEAGDMETAGATMATMDQKYAQIIQLLNRLEHDSHEIVGNKFSLRTQLAEDMRTFELAIGVIIAVMIVGVAVYGYKLSNQMRSYTQQLELQFASLKTSEQRLRDLVESSNQGMAIHREDRPLFVNRAWATVYGFNDVQDTYGRQRISDGMAPADLARLHEKRRQFLDHGEQLRMEFRARRQDGAIIGLEYTEHAIDWEGAPAILSVVVDVTARKHAEDVLVADRQKIEKVEMERTRFFAAAGHDIRQPLHTIGLLLPMLARTQPAKRKREILEVLNSAYGVMATLLDELLELARLEAGAAEPEIKPLRIGQLFRKLETEFLPQTGEAGIELRVVSSETTVATDPILFERIVRNLLSNAVQNTVKGRVLLGARHRRGILQVEVWDTGTGISRTEAKNIFSDFYRAARKTTSNATGLGLGLSIVRRLAELLGHRLDFHSELGKGTVFSIEAPIIVSTETDTPLVKGPRPLRELASLEGLHVLVIDDDEHILRAMKIAFDGWKSQAVLVRSGTEALKNFPRTDEPPDLVIVDFWLREGETGRDVIHAVREYFGRPVPTILISADKETAPISDAAQDGFKILAKPLRLNELHEAIHDVLGNTDQAEF